MDLLTTFTRQDQRGGRGGWRGRGGPQGGFKRRGGPHGGNWNGTPNKRPRQDYGGGFSPRGMSPRGRGGYGGN